jgi:hypothetical protein
VSKMEIVNMGTISQDSGKEEITHAFHDASTMIARPLQVRVEFSCEGRRKQLARDCYGFSL